LGRGAAFLLSQDLANVVGVVGAAVQEQQRQARVAVVALGHEQAHFSLQARGLEHQRLHANGVRKLTRVGSRAGAALAS
jgi:hypothetical protein